jgi:hypothetical protein
MNYKIEDLLDQIKKVDSMIEIHSNSDSVMLDQYNKIRIKLVNELASDLFISYSNDFELGSKWRSICIKSVELDESHIQYPNDYELGKFLRKKFK